VGEFSYLVSLFFVQLKLEEETINLVDKQNGFDTLTKSLSEHSLSLHTHTLDTVHHHESTISDTKGSSNLRREIDVP
jgi:hypothetical protein